MKRLSRQAPAVSYRLRRSSILGMVLASLGVLGAAALAVWSRLGAGTSLWPVYIGWALWGVALAGAVHYWYFQFCGALRWDGLQWQLEHSRSPHQSWVLSGAPEVFLDLQTHLCVGVSPVEGSRIWLWLERSAQPERWVDLRRAVYSRARPGADNADETAPANSRGRES